MEEKIKALEIEVQRLTSRNRQLERDNRKLKRSCEMERSARYKWEHKAKELMGYV